VPLDAIATTLPWRSAMMKPVEPLVVLARRLPMASMALKVAVPSLVRLVTELPVPS